MADEEIVLGGDTSGLVRALQQGRVAFEDLTKAAGLNDQQNKRIVQSYERLSGQIAAAALKNAAATKAQADAGKINTANMNAQAQAADRLAAAEKRAFAAQGLARNSGGRVISADTGRWASKEDIANAQTLTQTIMRLTEQQGLQASLERQRGINAQNVFAAEQKNLQVAREQTEAYKQRQAVLEKAFSGKTIGLANPDASGWEKLRNVMSQIPPVTWAQRFGAASEQLLKMNNSARYALYSVSASAAVAGAAIGGFGVLATNAAIAHERAFANVQRTTQTTGAGYEVLRKQLQGLAMELPVSYEEITKIATAAGQLGIQASGVTNFTKVVAQLSATTNLTSEAAGNALARFKAFFSTASDPSLAVTERTFGNLASSILKVGVNSIATESGIVNVATQISSMGRLAGFTANQVVGLSGALASVGVAPELSRGITTRLFTLIGDSVSASGVQLEKFAALSGVTASQFKAAWGTEQFAGVFTSLLQGIHGVEAEGGDANLVLRDLGITAQRDRPVWLRLAGAANELGQAGMLVAQTMEDAEEGWRQNSELAVQYTKISQTTAARLQVMAQAFEQLFASMGSETGNFVGEAAKNITALVRVFDEFAQSDAGKVFGSIVVQGSLVVGAILLVVATMAGLLATTQAVGAGFREMSAAGVAGMTRVAGALRVVAAASGIVGLLATLATTVGMFIATGAAAEKAASPIQDMSALLGAMRDDAEAGRAGVKFWGDTSVLAGQDAEGAKEKANDLSEALYGVKASGDGAAGGTSNAAKAAEKLKYVYSDAAEEIFKSSLLADEGFQNLFKGDLFRGVNPVDFNWEKIMRASMEGRDIDKIVVGEINKQLSEGGSDLTLGQLKFGNKKAAADLQELREATVRIFGGVQSDVQGAIDANAALEGSTNHTVAEMVDDYTLLEDVSKKTVDNMAAAFQSFVASDSLIGLTQKMNEIFSQQDVDTETKAAQWEEAWNDAYGGAAFSLEDYLSVFRRAAGEQDTFVTGLQTLKARMDGLGLDTALIEDLSAMGPKAAELIAALIGGTDEQLIEYSDLFGKTGYDSMIKLATQTAIGAEVVKNVLASKGLEGLRAFNDSLASGVGVDEALATLQLDVNGNPIKPTIETPPTDPLMNSLRRNLGVGIGIPVTPYLTKSTVYTTGNQGGSYGFYMAAQGGHITGPGSGTSDDIPAWLSNGEFVMTAKATRNIGVDNLYALMHQAQNGRSAPRGRGYATGGMVGSGPNGSRSDIMVVELSAYDRMLLAEAGNVRLSIDGKDVQAATNNANFVAGKRGSS